MTTVFDKLKKNIEEKKAECFSRIHSDKCKRSGKERNFHKIAAYNEVLMMIAALEGNSAYEQWKKDQTYQDYLRFRDQYLNDAVVFNCDVHNPYSDFGLDILEICPDGIVLDSNKFKDGDNVRVMIVKDNKE